MTENNPVKEMLRGSYYYESKSVSCTRKAKMCDICNGSIPKGSSHNGATLFNGDFYPVVFCKECESKYAKELNEMASGLYDSY